VSNGAERRDWKRPFLWIGAATLGIAATVGGVLLFRSRKAEAADLPAAPSMGDGPPPPPSPAPGGDDSSSAPPPPPGPDQTPSDPGGGGGSTQAEFQPQTPVQMDFQPSAQPVVPDTPHCDNVEDWPEEWVAKEEELLAAVNALRAQGFTCATGTFAPAPPLTMNPKLRCSSRRHSMNMAEANFFSHVDPQGLHSWERMQAAGYEYDVALENIAAGYNDVPSTMQQWKVSTSGHCEALMNPDVTEIGIGYYYKPGTQSFYYWTQNFGKPAS